MSLTVDFTPNEEARIQAAARQEGVEPADVLKSLVAQHLPPLDETWRSKLRHWQEQEGLHLPPVIPARELFSKQDGEYQAMTEAERDAEDQLWVEIEAALNRGNLNLRPVE